MSNPASSAPRVSADSLVATLHGVMLDIGLRLDEVRIESRGASLGGDPMGLSLTEAAHAEVRVGPESLKRYLESKGPDVLREIEIAFRDGLIHIDAVARIMFEVSVKASCHLRIEDGKRLLVELDHVDVAGIGGRGLVQGQIDKINPVFDAADLPLDLTLEAVTIQDTAIVLTGRANV